MNHPSASAPLYLATLSVALFILLAQPLTAAPPTPPEQPATGYLTLISQRELTAAGWKLSKPSYPRQAMETHEQGELHIKITTDNKGKVVKAVVSNRLAHPKLAPHLENWALTYWHGPPNRTVLTLAIFQLVGVRGEFHPTGRVFRPVNR